MSRFVLVRHGETVWHAGNRYAGSSDVALSEHGCEQARALAQWAATASLTALYVSPLRRARETGRPVEAACSLTATVEARLRELAFGRGEGLTAREMQEQFPEQYSAFCNDPIRHHLPGGEDPVVAVARAREALAEIAAQTGPQARVLVVAHNTLIRLLLCDLLGIALARYRRVFPQLDNVAITELEWTENGVALLRFNAPLPHHPL